MKTTTRLRAGILVLPLAAGLAVAGLALRAAAPAAAQPAGTQVNAALASAALFNLPPERWKDPPKASGVPPYPLVVHYGRNSVRVGPTGQPQTVNLRSYNGGLAGPTFRVKAGQTLRVDLLNQLPEGSQGGHPRFNVTNLHTHGLHISPTFPSDDVLKEFGPTKRANFKFDILPAGNPSGEKPMSHYPGTDWYHAHLHHATAVQLASGMAGALIVEGDIDGVAEIKAAEERIFIFQQLAFDKNGEIKIKDPNNQIDLIYNWIGKDPNVNGPKKHTTINGVVKPLILLRPDQVERWRLIDAGIFEELNLSLIDGSGKDHDLQLFSRDGITLKRPRLLKRIDLAPGYRADLLVKAPPKPGTYYLYKNKPAVSLMALQIGPELAGQVDQTQVVAEIKVEGESCSSRAKPCASKLLPADAKLPAPLPDILPQEVAQKRNVTFSVESGKFLINGRTYCPSKVHPDFQLTKGKTEEWTLKNTSSGPHPFHIHVNAFQMVEEDGTPGGKPGDWRDTIVIPAGKTLRMRTRIERFTGQFVLHCHILTHEDAGMMQLVEVKEKWPAEEPGGGEDECPPEPSHHDASGGESHD